MDSSNPSNDGSQPGSVDGFCVNIKAKTFPAAGDAPAVKVLESLSFSISSGEFLAVIGPSGCGKTTLLNLVAGLDKEFSGDVPKVEKTGFVFQSPRLLPWMTVAGNLRLVLGQDQGQDVNMTAMLAAVGLQGQETVFANRLSMGMARRVALARALLVEPDIMLMDEPFVSLDESTADNLRAMLSDLLELTPRSILFVTHDLSEAVRLADRVLILGNQPTTTIGEMVLDRPRKDRDEEWIRQTKGNLRTRL
ncbi:MAG: ATP-binding cassette domain-containing protein [Rhodospirillaceae bacterium]|nr:ATP-binding cassette domain-containing protein [Rhodospirillaceae bacterium]MBL6930326.1 ATP-binding cassette domain-containing protein [Rhodospirillales bacterium]